MEIKEEIKDWVGKLVGNKKGLEVEIEEIMRGKVKWHANI